MKELLEKVAVPLLAAAMGMAGGALQDRLTIESRTATAGAQIQALNQRMDNMQLDLREIRQLLMDQRRAEK